MTTIINASNSGSGGLVQTADASGVLALQTAGTTAVTVDTSQNVGIGITSPSQKLDIYGAAQISYSGINSYLYFQSTSNYVGRATDGNFWMNVAGSQNILFGVAASEKMRIDSSGNVGIGTTSPGYKFDVAQNSASNNFIGRFLNTDTGSSSGAAIIVTQGAVTAQFQSYGNSNVYVGSQSNHPVGIQTNSVERIRIDTSGNVGIGTNSPSSYGLLSVVSSTAGSAKISIQDTSGGSSPAPLLQFGVNNSNGFNTSDAARIWTTSATSSVANLNFSAYNNGGTSSAQMILTSGSLLIGAANTAVLPTGYVSTANTFGFKNRIMNGNMRIWQRATSGTSIAVGSYGPDRWRVGGGNALTLTQSTTYGSPQSLLIQATGTNHAVGQRIEAKNIQDLAGQTVTLSYKIRADNPGTHRLLMYYAGSADDFSAEVNFVNAAISYVSNAVTTITYTTTLPANVTNGLDIVFQWYNGGTSINITAFIWDVQIEAGPAATSFDIRPHGTEQSLCERYYWKSTVGTYNAIGAGSVTGSSQVSIYIKYPTTMRAAPTVSYSGTVYVFGISNQTVTAISSSYAGNFSGRFDFTPTSTMTTGGGAILFTEQTGNNYVQGSAEL